jgi:hypothetical protein
VEELRNINATLNELSEVKPNISEKKARILKK